MSHLFKNDLKKYFYFLKILIICSISILFYYGLINYSGKILIYISFSIIFNFILYFGFRKNAVFFETFLSLLLWLGFWFKFTCIISFTDGLFREGVGSFNYEAQSFDQALIISQIGALAVITGGYIREFFLFNYPKKINFDFKKNSFFVDNRNKLWFIFIIFFLFISISNYYFKIYQKGLIPLVDFNFIFSGTYKWLLLFGLSTISTIIIYFEAKNLKKFFVFSSLIIIFETFMSSLSMLSRGMIFNSFAILYGIYKFSNKIDIKNTMSYYFKYVLFVIFLFYLSVASVNSIRSNFFYIGKSAKFTYENLQNTNKIVTNKKKYSLLTKYNQEIFYLLVNRWVGIDGVMSVISNKDILSFNFFKDSFKEAPNSDSPTLYELKFNLETLNKDEKIYQNVKGNTLPGIFAFLFYSGSYFFVFISIVILTLLASIIEFIAYRYSSKNLIFSSLIGQIIAYRLIHFGYLPQQSYLLFGTILITIFFVYLLNLKINNKSND